jgi:hypothetical protein
VFVCQHPVFDACFGGELQGGECSDGTGVGRLSSRRCIAAVMIWRSA